MLHNFKQTTKPNVVVAADGSGKYKTINEAINALPPNSIRRSVISNRSNVTGTSTSLTATFAAIGKGFIASDMGFQNTAGPNNHQAVAFLSASDQSVFYRCLIDAYQDTLYTQSNRQFYRECEILGTIDFIFGDSAVVIKSSSILVKKPLHSQGNAHNCTGKDNPHSNTGISIQKCSILPAENLDGVKTFLGRPWKDYSTTIVMESQLGSFIDPNGWLPWNKRTPDAVPDNIFYAEYN